MPLDIAPLTPEQTGVLIAALAMALAALALIWAAIRTARRAQAEHARAMAATAEALIRAHQLDARPPHNAAHLEHQARLARLRAISRENPEPQRSGKPSPRPGETYDDYRARLALTPASRSAIQPKRPASTNPGPGLRPHPVQAARERDAGSAWIIPPFSAPTPPAQAGGTHATDTTESIVVPIPAGSGGEFAGAGAGGSWDSYTDTSSSASSSSSD